MNRFDYILRSLSKTSKKRWEHYAVNRIYHRLDDPGLEFICQQCSRGKDKLYLVDLFFPQLGLYLEIDEGHYDVDQAKIKDAKRSFDILGASGLEERRIKASQVTIEKFNECIDNFVELVRRRKKNAVDDNRFRPWDYERRFTAAPHLESGFIEIGPHAAFRTHKDALNCFGYNKGHWQRGVWDLPIEVAKSIGHPGKCMVWFPKLYEQPNWINSLSDDGETIVEINKNPEHVYEEPYDTRIVMARSRDELNRTLYRFVGVFEALPDFRTGNEHRFKRIATKVKTYPSSDSARG
ncbi:AbaSI family restriction endonuclease [Paracoccus tegillarcae]|uniref:Uncharacterized protein n=1 Tax=Paracoccus tegillarcae TaxID=1529068 RepID=A0A2K9F0N2_9RHOB|nr:hypothetical protein [Paracoccus tegillarcae]AUH35124.1 hypothetical protein CUV01_01245 [Paracoccus tegillarcae]